MSYWRKQYNFFSICTYNQILNQGIETSFNKPSSIATSLLVKMMKLCFGSSQLRETTMMALSQRVIGKSNICVKFNF